MLLSQLKNKENFKFLPDQEIYYLLGRSPHGILYKTNCFTVFEVLKQNDKSVKVKPIDERVEYYFKYAGPLNNDTVQCQDVNVTKIELEILGGIDFYKNSDKIIEIVKSDTTKA